MWNTQKPGLSQKVLVTDSRPNMLESRNVRIGHITRCTKLDVSCSVLWNGRFFACCDLQQLFPWLFLSKFGLFLSTHDPLGHPT